MFGFADWWVDYMPEPYRTNFRDFKSPFSDKTFCSSENGLVVSAIVTNRASLSSEELAENYDKILLRLAEEAHPGGEFFIEDRSHLDRVLCPIDSYRCVFLKRPGSNDKRP